MDACLLDTSGLVVVCHSEPQGVLCEHFSILITEQVVLWLAPPDCHVFSQNHKHLGAKGADLNPTILCVPIHHLPTVQVHIPVLNVAKGRSSTPRVQQIIDNHPVAILAEITVLGRSSHKDGEFRICISFLDCFPLLQVGHGHIGQAFILTPPQESIHHSQIGGDGVVSQSSFFHGNHHSLQVPFGQFIEGHFNVEVFGNRPQVVMVV